MSKGMITLPNGSIEIAPSNMVGPKLVAIAFLGTL